MKKLTADDLKNLSYGEQVLRIQDGNHMSFRYVGRIPGSNKYLIFSEGEILEHLYISDDGNFSGDWYGGDYNNEFVGNLLIDYHINKINAIREIYLKKERLEGVVDIQLIKKAINDHLWLSTSDQPYNEETNKMIDEYIKNNI